MKKGKDDEKVMGPMFPRLHVNDTEKGGPRAPPRNKMALYEQLCIPSQRFNPGVRPLNPNSTSNQVPPVSSSQVIFGFCCLAYIPYPVFYGCYLRTCLVRINFLMILLGFACDPILLEGLILSSTIFG